MNAFAISLLITIAFLLLVILLLIINLSGITKFRANVQVLINRFYHGTTGLIALALAFSVLGGAGVIYWAGYDDLTESIVDKVSKKLAKDSILRDSIQVKVINPYKETVDEEVKGYKQSLDSLDNLKDSLKKETERTINLLRQVQDKAKNAIDSTDTD